MRYPQLNATPIEYVDYSWNPITGCLEGCPYCYARGTANKRVRKIYLANPNVLAGDPADVFAPRFWPDRMATPKGNRKSSAIFVVDMGDLFGIGVPPKIINQVIQVAFECPQHDFLFLTKQPHRLRQFAFPPNAWVGCTATNERQLENAYSGLVDLKADHRFISFEPLLERLPTTWLEPIANIVDWFIIGAQTKPTIKPDPVWLLEMECLAQKHSVPIFYKDTLIERGIREWPKDYRKGVRDALEI